MATTSAAIRDLSDQNSQGTRLGVTSTDLIGFYGLTTCVAQVSVIGSSIGVNSQAPINSSQGNVFGFSSQAQAQAIVSTMLQLKNMGLIF